jgi:hypothetical protein
MAAPAKLVTLTQAKAHLALTTPPGDPGDAEIQDFLDAAEDVILTYLKDNPDRATWIDPVSAPGPVVSAIKLMLGQLYMHRGDDDADGEAFWQRIDRVLAQYHTPAVA